MIKKFFLKILSIYQHYISPLTPNSCRYYPTCSEYSKWQYENNSVGIASLLTLKRILTCNALFKGGFDYPIVKRDLKKNPLCLPNQDKKLLNVKYFLIPKDESRFLLIKRFKGNNFD